MWKKLYLMYVLKHHVIILQEAGHHSMQEAGVAGGSNFLALLTFLIPPVLNLQGFIPSYYSHTLCDLIARPYLKLWKLTNSGHGHMHKVSSQHSSEIRGLRSKKCSSETLQNLLYVMYKKTHVVVFIFHFVQLYVKNIKLHEMKNE